MSKTRIKTKEDIEKIRYSCSTLGNLLYSLRERIKPGLNILDIDSYVEDYIRSYGGVPSFKGFHGFPSASCISVNENVIHGVPHSYELRDGDIVGIDIGMNYKGGFGDTAYTYGVGDISDELCRLLEVTERSLYCGIEQALRGNRVGDISSAVQVFVESRGYTLVREYCGHGVGLDVWEPPSIPNVGSPGIGERLRGGMVIAIEPMVNMGGAGIFVGKDGWTVTTKDGSYSAHFEHTVLICEDGSNEVLTKVD